MPPIVDEATFAAVQALVGKPRGRPADAEPILLSGLLYCANHLTLHRAKQSRSRYPCYRCDADNLAGRASRDCLNLAAFVLDSPVAEYVLGRLSVASLADEVFAASAREQGEAHAVKLARQRQRRELVTEQETIVAQLARTTNDRLSQRLIAASTKSRSCSPNSVRLPRWRRVASRWMRFGAC